MNEGWSVYVDDGDLGRRLRGFAAQLVNLRPFWPIAARIGRGWIKQQLDSEGSWGGDPWEPLSPAYAAWKAVHYPGRPILWAERKLRAAALAPERVATADTLELRINDPKARWHQRGTRKMPARPIIPPRLPADALDELRDAFDQWVGDLIDRWGLGSGVHNIGPGGMTFTPGAGLYSTGD